jgi:hypothetical protein
MKQSAVYLKYSGQGFAYDAIAIWVLAKRSLFYSIIFIAFSQPF